MQKLVLSNQCGFIKDRSLSSCAVAASEFVNLLDRRCFVANIGIFVYFTKYFDRVDRFFLLKVLDCFGFFLSL